MSVLAIAKTREIAERMDAGEPFFPRCEGSSTPSDVMCRARRKRCVDATLGAPFCLGAKVILQGPQVRIGACLTDLSAV